MAATVAETIKEITRQHLESKKGILLGQCVTAVGWIGGTVPDCEGIVEIPMTDVAAAGFAVGAALKGIRPIFVVRYQGFMWYNCSSFVNYAARSKAVWNQPVPIFIRSIGMEGNGIGHTASSCLHSIFMHPPGLKVYAPMTPNEYRKVWDSFSRDDDPYYVSEHRRSFTINHEMIDETEDKADVCIIAISAARLNAIDAVKQLRESGLKCHLHHLVDLKPLNLSEKIIHSVKSSKMAMVVDSDFQICGAAEHVAYKLMLETGQKVHALGLKDMVCGAAKHLENITPSSDTIALFAQDLIKKGQK